MGQQTETGLGQVAAGEIAAEPLAERLAGVHECEEGVALAPDVRRATPRGGEQRGAGGIVAGQDRHAPRIAQIAKGGITLLFAG